MKKGGRWMTPEQLKSDFTFDMMWEAAPRRELSVTKSGDVLLAVRKAYADMSVRTIKGFSKVSNEKKEELRENFAEKFIGTFCTAGAPLTQEAFDERHQEVCDDFLTKLNNLCDGVNINPDQKPCFGKAQKIVNMTFKYLYLFEKNEPIQPLFAFCHMPLDSNIFEYLKKKFKSHGLNAKLFETAWSKLNGERYMEIQTAIRKYCQEYSSDYADAADECAKLPFYAEFPIWEEMRREKQAKEGN